MKCVRLMVDDNLNSYDVYDARLKLCPTSCAITLAIALAVNHISEHLWFADNSLCHLHWFHLPLIGQLIPRKVNGLMTSIVGDQGCRKTNSSRKYMDIVYTSLTYSVEASQRPSQRLQETFLQPSKADLERVPLLKLRIRYCFGQAQHLEHDYDDCLSNIYPPYAN